VNFQLFGLLQQFGLLNQFGYSAFDRFGQFKGLGYLGLPKPALAQVGFVHCFQTRVVMLFNEFNRAREQMVQLAPGLMTDPRFNGDPAFAALISDFLTSNAEWTALLSELHADPRVAALHGTMISTGSGGTAFEESRLAEWYLWCANEFGLEIAKQHLNQWLDADKVDVVNTLWIYGLNLDEEIQLADGYCITPAERLPDSTHKEQALQFKMPTPGEVVSFPTVAITRTCRVRKAYPADLAPDSNRDPDFWKTQTRLYDIALVLNALPGVSCWPAFATAYPLATHPYGPFGGWGGGTYLYDVIGRQQTKITQEHVEDILAALADFTRLRTKEQERFRRILSRLSQGKRRFEIEDKTLDLGIALEMLLLKDNPNREQLALSFRLRGAWLVSGTSKERRENYKLLKELYTYRSHVAHSGLLENGNPQKIAQVRNQFPAYQALAEKICRRLLNDPQVDWDALLVGGVGGEA
jgi:hypothetical protein